MVGKNPVDPAAWAAAQHETLKDAAESLQIPAAVKFIGKQVACDGKWSKLVRPAAGLQKALQEWDKALRNAKRPASPANKPKNT